VSNCRQTELSRYLKIEHRFVEIFVPRVLAWGRTGLACGPFHGERCAGLFASILLNVGGEQIVFDELSDRPLVLNTVRVWVIGKLMVRGHIVVLVRDCETELVERAKGQLLGTLNRQCDTRCRRFVELEVAIDMCDLRIVSRTLIVLKDTYQLVMVRVNPTIFTNNGQDHVLVFMSCRIGRLRKMDNILVREVFPNVRSIWGWRHSSSVYDDVADEGCRIGKHSLESLNDFRPVFIDDLPRFLMKYTVFEQFSTVPVKLDSGRQVCMIVSPGGQSFFQHTTKIDDL